MPNRSRHSHSFVTPLLSRVCFMDGFQGLVEGSQQKPWTARISRSTVDELRPDRMSCFPREQFGSLQRKSCFLHTLSPMISERRGIPFVRGPSSENTNTLRSMRNLTSCSRRPAAHATNTRSEMRFYCALRRPCLPSIEIILSSLSEKQIECTLSKLVLGMQANWRQGSGKVHPFAFSLSLPSDVGKRLDRRAMRHAGLMARELHRQSQSELDQNQS
jgi:hypothetical protein